MPVRLGNKSGRRGKVAVSLGNSTGALVGSLASPGTFLGVFKAVLYDFTAALTGTYSANAQRSGIITTTLQNNFPAIIGDVNSVPVWLTAAALADTTPNTAFTYTLTAQDIDSDPILISLIGSLPSGVTATINPQSGTQRSVTLSSAGLPLGSYTFTYDATDIQPLAQVTGLTVNATSYSAISTNWSAVSGATSYGLERSTDQTTWTSVVTQATTNYSDTSVSASTTYYYRVRAINSQTTGPYSATASATTPTAPSASAESDWLSRSTGARVVWAHDFRTDREVYNFTDFKFSEVGTLPSYATGAAQPDFTDGVAGTGGGCLALTFPSNPAHVVRSITAVATNRARIVLNEPHDYSATRPDIIRFQNIPTGPWNQGVTQLTPTLNDWRKGAGGTCVLWKVTNVVDATTFDIDTQTIIVPGAGGWAPMGDVSGFAPYVGSTSATLAPQDATGLTSSTYCTSGRMATGEWHRPFSSFVGGTTTGNGRGAGLDDIGIANGMSPSRTWVPVDGTGAASQNSNSDPSWNSNAAVFIAHAKDFYGYSGYSSTIDAWKTYSTHITQSGMYRGDDFWIQYRQKLPLNRYQLGDAALRNPDLKLISPWTNYGTPGHEIHQNDLNIPLARYQQIAWPLNAGGLPKWYTNQNDPNVWVANRYQTNGDYDLTCRAINPQAGTTYPNVSSCFHWPPDEWCAVLWHVKMGYGNFLGPGSSHGTGPYGYMTDIWSPWATGGANAAVSTAVQLWVCPQSRIDAARANGTTPQWITVWNNYGTSGYPLNQSQAWEVENAGAINYDTAGPFFNTLWVNTYQNSIPVFLGYTRKFTQFIFKKGTGGFDPYVDGIPCPRY